MTRPLFTVTLVSGHEAIAKRHPWLGIQALTYSNFGQARKMQELLGHEWRVLGNKPYIYVVKIKGRKTQ